MGAYLPLIRGFQPQGRREVVGCAAEDDFLKFVGEAATFDQVISYANVCPIAGNMQEWVAKFLSRLAPILL